MFIESAGLWDGADDDAGGLCWGCCCCCEACCWEDCEAWASGFVLVEALLTTEARWVLDEVGKMGEPVSLTGEVGESVESRVFFFFRNPKEGM